MKFDTIIFDLDGTLLDTLDDLTKAVGVALADFGYAALDRNRVRRYVGDGVPKLIERAVFYSATGREPDLSGKNEVDRSLVSACLALFTEYYDKHNADLTEPYPGVAGMLAAVKELGIKSAIVTNKYDVAARELKDVFFPSVDVVVGAQAGIRPKPSPDGVYKALELLSADTAHAIYVGDGETDMKTAAACKMPAVAVTWGFRDESVLRTFEPAFVIHEPRELLNVLDGGVMREEYGR